MRANINFGMGSSKSSREVTPRSSRSPSPVPVQEISPAFRRNYSATRDVPREIRDIRDIPWEIPNSSIYLHTGTGNRNAKQMSSIKSRSSACCCKKLTITILFTTLGMGAIALFV